MLTFWMACTQRPAGTFGGICHRLGKLGLSTKSHQNLPFKTKFHRIPLWKVDFFRKIWHFGGETLKILGKILSIRLTDWKLSKRNRPKLEDAIFVNLPSFDTSLKKKNFRMAQQRCVHFSVSKILVFGGWRNCLSEVVGGRSHNKRSERSVSEHKGLDFIKKYYPPSSCHRKGWNMPQPRRKKLCFDCLQMEGQS